MNQERKTTSPSTWIVAAIAAMGILAATAYQLYQGVDAEKARTAAAIQEAAAKMDPKGIPAVKMGPGKLASSPGGDADHPEADASPSSGPVSADELKKSLDAVPELMATAIDCFQSLKGSLEGIQDVETAKTALPDLEKFSGQLDGISKSFRDLPETARAGLIRLVEGGYKQLSEKTATILALPGVEDVLNPVLNGILEKVASMLKS